VKSDVNGDDWLSIYETPGKRRVVHIQCGDSHCSGKISPGGKWIAAFTDDETVKVYDAAAGRLVGESNVAFQRIGDAEFSSDGRWLIVPRTEEPFDEEPRKPAETTVWGLSPWRRFPQTWTGKTAVSENGQFFAGFRQGKLEVVDLVRGTTIASLFSEGISDAIAFSPDGKLVANLSAGSSLVRVWDVLSRTEIAQISTEMTKISDRELQFSSDGRSLAITGYEGLQVWRLRAEDLAAEACSRVMRNLRPDEWTLYVGEEPRKDTCILEPKRLK
jgi:WD40 repeat protein